MIPVWLISAIVTVILFVLTCKMGFTCRTSCCKCADKSETYSPVSRALSDAFGRYAVKPDALIASASQKKKRKDEDYSPVSRALSDAFGRYAAKPDALIVSASQKKERKEEEYAATSSAAMNAAFNRYSAQHVV